MSESYDGKLCEERHKNVTENLKDHEVRLNNHAGRLDKLEQNEATHSTEIKNLCTQIRNLVNTLKWGMGLVGASFLGLFLYLLELHLK
jgi:chaperonin cofactor prefoldin